MTLDKIEKALADYDAKMADGLEEYGYWSSRIGAKEYVDAVRLLLPIAQAARELIEMHIDSDYGWMPEPPFVDELNKLHEALEGLED